MKKIRIFLMCAAVISAICLAAAEVTAKTEPACIYSQQYYKLGFNYFPTGQLGLHYVCFTGPSWICTYYVPDPVSAPDDYYPCRSGYYYQIEL